MLRRRNNNQAFASLPPPPHARGGWAGARGRWEHGVLLPFEKLVAVLAVGQMMRIGVGTLYVWAKLDTLIEGKRRRKPTVTQQAAAQAAVAKRKADDDAQLQAHLDKGQPIFFFRALERPTDAGQTVLVPQPAAFALLERMK